MHARNRFRGRGAYTGVFAFAPPGRRAVAAAGEPAPSRSRPCAASLLPRLKPPARFKRPPHPHFTQRLPHRMPRHSPPLDTPPRSSRPRGRPLGTLDSNTNNTISPAAAIPSCCTPPPRGTRGRRLLPAMLLPACPRRPAVAPLASAYRILERIVTRAPTAASRHSLAGQPADGASRARFFCAPAPGILFTAYRLLPLCLLTFPFLCCLVCLLCLRLLLPPLWPRGRPPAPAPSGSATPIFAATPVLLVFRVPPSWPPHPILHAFRAAPSAPPPIAPTAPRPPHAAADSAGGRPPLLVRPTPPAAP